MKVAELSGVMLDYWVGRAQGWHPTVMGGKCMEGRETSHEFIEYSPWSPSTDWARGGPIIERERIVIAPLGSSAWGASVYGRTYVRFIDESEADMDATDQTPLIAAMRAYVASKFGDEVTEDGE